MEYVQQKWQLDDLYSSTNNNFFEEEKKSLLEKAKSFEKYRNALTSDLEPQTFASIIHEYEEITLSASRLMAFAELLFSEDTQNSKSLSLYGQIESLITDVFNQLLFFDLWWKALDEDKCQLLAASCPQNAYYLKELRLSKNFTLSEKEEKIISLKNITGSSALNNIYESITNGYSFKLAVDNETKILTRDALMTFAKDTHSSMRKAAYTELYRVYAEDGNVLAQIYQNVCRDWYQENIGLRKFKSPIAVRNLSNNIPDDVIDLLLTTCQKNKDIFIEYFAFKKNLLNLDEFHRYDLYAPLTMDENTIGFDNGFKMVLASYQRFDPSFKEMAERVYKKMHIDSEVRHGKRGGAFCLTASPQYTPWVLTNYQNKMNDVSTLAHELGHAIHSMCAEDKTVFEQQACLPLAETASTFGEMLLADYLSETVTDKNIIRSNLIKQLDDNYATIQRQAYFALFEKTAHQMIIEGADVEALNEAYLANLQDQFGSSMVIDDFFKWEWISIPHIYASPFYVYAYAFGQLLVLSLYKQYKLEGTSFIPKYKELLHSGGYASPEQILTKAGFDFRSQSFWQGGFDILRAKLALLKGL